MSSGKGNSAVWKLFYWPGMRGRGEFARLIFAESDTPYDDVYSHTPIQRIREMNQQLRDNTNSPFFALPVIIHTPTPESTPFLLSQTPAIVRYLASQLDGGRLLPKTIEDDHRAIELTACIVDVVAEGHDAWHAIDKNGSYSSQKKETQPFIDYYLKRRLPIWSNNFEARLKANGGEFFIGTNLSYADLCVFHWLDGIQFQCPAEYTSLPIPLLRAFKEKIGQRPRIAQRIATRTETWDGTGPIF